MSKKRVAARLKSQAGFYANQDEEQADMEVFMSVVESLKSVALDEDQIPSFDEKRFFWEFPIEAHDKNRGIRPGDMAKLAKHRKFVGVRPYSQTSMYLIFAP